MICPNCKATDHESGAKYCHRCGSPLVNNNGSSIERPKQQNRYIQSSVPDGVEAIDLGLPSGTKWANMNIGATKPEEYGAYYAWGEIEEKDKYDDVSYCYCDGFWAKCHNLGSSISGTTYDVAHVKWGINWEMPSYEQIMELVNECAFEWCCLNNVYGGRFTGPNGNSIFLPAAGAKYPNGVERHGEVGTYWSGTAAHDSTITSNQPKGEFILAYGLGFNGSCNSKYGFSGRRDLGHTIRPVLA